MTLTGTGTGPVAKLSPKSLQFATQLVGTASPQQTVTLTNSGNATLNIVDIFSTGAFTQSNTCGSALSPSASCGISVIFDPAIQGSLTGTVSVNDNASGSPQLVSLHGSGTVAEFAPASLSFGNEKVGATSTPQTVTFTNTGSTTLQNVAITITGTDAADFAQSNTCGSKVSALTSCTILRHLYSHSPGNPKCDDLDQRYGRRQPADGSHYGNWNLIAKFGVTTLCAGACRRHQIAAVGGSSIVKIMTQNIDEGTGEGYIVAALFGQLPLPDAVDLTVAELQASHLQERARLIAGQIATQKPDIVALQEVALWRNGLDTQHAFTPVYDQLEYFVDDLLRLGVPYVVAGINTVDDLTLAGNKIGALRLTERNVLLARADLRRPQLYFTDVQSHIFSSVLDIGGLQVPSGWISATVHVGDQQFLLAAVHLESTVPGYPPATDV